jgi:SET domain-containing protein
MIHKSRKHRKQRRQTKTTTSTSRRQSGGRSGRTVKVRALVYRNHSKNPNVIIRVQKGPKPFLFDILNYHIEDAEEYIMDVMKGFPKPPYKEEIMVVEYKK